MPRSIQILDHGDELAKRVQDHEAKTGDERPIEEYVLEPATITCARGDVRSSMPQGGRFDRHFAGIRPSRAHRDGLPGGVALAQRRP